MRTALLSSLLLTMISSSVFANLKSNSQPVVGETYVNDPILPPQIQWHGKSESLLQSSDNPWVTDFELSGYIDSPSYQRTFTWLDELIDSSSKLKKVSLGKSPQGRDIWMVIATKTGKDNPSSLNTNGKPTLLVQAGIHAGEIDGKDAGMMLLRDIVHGNKSQLLDNVNLLFVPIFNVDGHERADKHNRVNQRGPISMGWRTNANNLNLNRDYAKVDTLEMQHMLAAINTWQPDLYVDIHVTDGIDYQYDVTYGYNLSVGLSPQIFDWFENTYRPQLDNELSSQGHIPGPLVFAEDKMDLSKGMSLWNASPRYSNGYGDARHLPTILIENHSLKPYKQRVLGTYVMLEQTLKTLASQGTKLKAAIAKDKYSYPQRITLSWKQEQQTKSWDFKGIEYTKEFSQISGKSVVRWSGQPKLYPNLPVIGGTKPDVVINRPSAYFIPPQWQKVIKRLKQHGIRMTTLTQPQTTTLQQYVFSDHQFANEAYEGHTQVSATAKLSQQQVTLPIGTIKIDTEQPLGNLAILLLEPQHKDSLFQWGFFNPIFTRTEYIEDYAVEPLAKKMLAADPQLQKQFDKALQDKSFADDSKARLRWFYEQSPYFDKQYLTYPVYKQQ